MNGETVSCDALKQCPANCTLRALTICDTRGRLPYICLRVGWRFHDRFLTRIKSLVYVPSNLFSSLAERVHVSDPYRRIGSISVLKIFVFISVSRLETQILCRSLQADQAIPFLVLKSFSELEMKEPRYL